MTETGIKINRGLKGVYFERSGVGDIDGERSELRYSPSRPRATSCCAR